MDFNETTGLRKVLSDRFTYRQECLEDWERYFCTPSYLDSMVAARPCVLEGSRGSGKTTALRCLSYNSRRRLLLEDAGKIESWSYFGMFHRMDSSNGQVFSGPEISGELWQKLFIHYLNLQMIRRLLVMLGDIEKDFDEPVQLSDEICSAVGRLAGLPANPKGVCGLRSAVEEALLSLLETVSNIGEEKEFSVSPLGDAFRLLIQSVKKIDRFKNIRFFYLIDEYENLSENQQRVVNTLIKHCAPDYYIKIGIRKHGLRTNLTLVDDEFLAHPADYERIEIYKALSDERYRDFALSVVSSRISGLPITQDLTALFEKITLREEMDRYCPPSLRKQIEADWREVVGVNLNLSLLKKLFLLGYQDHHRIHSDRLIEYSNDPANDPSLKDAYGNYAFSVVLASLRSTKSRLKKRYSGIDTLIDLSGRNIRYFTELIIRSFYEELGDANRLETISVDAQSSAVVATGEVYLEEIEVRGLRGKGVRRLMAGIGSVFEGLSRTPFEGPPEITQFLYSSDGSIPSEADRAEQLLRDSVTHGGLLEAIRTKAEIAGDAKISEYRIFPLFCPFFGFSHRKKRQINLLAREIVILASDPEEGAKLVLKRLRKGRKGGEELEELF